MAESKVPAIMAGTYIHIVDIKKKFPDFDLGTCQPCTRRVVIQLGGAGTLVSAEFTTDDGINQLDFEL